MQHCIVGSGLIGSFIGGVMTANGQRVDFVARGQWKTRLQKPIMLTDYLDNKAVVTCSTEQSKVADVIWLTVKCTGLHQVIDTLRDLVESHSVIVCCQNGVGSHRVIQQAFPQHQVLRAMVPFNVVLASEQHLHKGSEGTLTLENSNNTHLTQQLADALSHSLIEVHTTENIDAVQWAKLQLNLGNGVNALADLPVKSMLEDRGYRRVIASLMDELLTVVKHSNITLPKVAKVHGKWLPAILRLPDWLFSRVAKQMLDIDPTVKTSMWWDLQNKKPTEKDFLYGAVVKQASNLGIEAPLNKAMIRLIEKTEVNSSNDNSRSGLSPAELFNMLNICAKN